MSSSGTDRGLVFRARYRATIERDLLRLRLRARGLRDAAPPADARPALIVSMTDFAYQVKLEAVLGRALEPEGLEPIALLDPGSTFARRYFEALGIRRFVQLPDYAEPSHADEAERVADELLAGDLSVPVLKALHYRDVPLGRPVLATVSRILHDAVLDPADPEVRALIAEMTRRVVRATLAGGALLDDLDPELLLFNERNYAAEAPLSEIALLRGINVVQFVSAFQDDGLVFKRFTRETRRVHPRSLSAGSWERVRRLEWTEARQAELDEEVARRYDNSWGLSRRNHGWTHELPTGEVVASLGLDPSRRTATVFSHVLWDANMFYGEDLFADQEEWFVETLRAVCENDRVNWIVKLHPANVWKRRRDGVAGELGELVTIRERIGELPPHVRLLRPESEISTRSIFDVSDYGVTIRGTVGVELPCLGVPVLTAGTGFYSGLGFTVDSATPEEYLGRLAAIQEIPPLTAEQTTLARRHAHAIFRLRPTRFTSFRSTFRPLSEIGHPLDHDLELAVRTSAELREADDLRRFARWAVRSRELDYLELPDGEDA